MNKINIEVPDYIEFISDWKDYVIPFGHCIIDKGITGCGFTEYCLTNQDNIILCSPRKLLLENKMEQHIGNSNICYLQNNNERLIEYDCYQVEKKRKDIDEPDLTSIINPFTGKVHQHSVNCQSRGLPIKFLVTYDSFHYLLQELGDSIKNYKIVIDEFQSLFSDSTFKAETESSLLEYLQDCPNVCYLSATPALDRYLDSISEFKDLDMYVFNWPDSLIDKVKIDMKRVKSIYEEGKKVIEQYKVGTYPVIITPEKQVYESRELVIYLNSVVDIIKLIKSCSLTTQNTDIICADTEYNRKRLKKIGFSLSRPNTYENRHLNKMFTFCTRTVYLGADFYSDNASSIVLSNPNKQHLAIDVATDLAQIIGRQRLRGNLFRKKCFLYYQTSNSVQTEEEFQKIIQEKMDNSGEIISSYDCLPDKSKTLWSEKLRDSVTLRHYSKDYVGISRKTGCPGINRFVLLAESRFWEITQKNYLDTINVRRDEVRNMDISLKQRSPQVGDIDKYILYFNEGTGRFREKLESYCHLVDMLSGNPEILEALNRGISDPRYLNYYNYFGPERLKSLGYEDFRITQVYQADQFNLQPHLDQLFQIGSSYSRVFIKTSLSALYQSLGIPGTAKASDIEKYFEVSDCKVQEGNTRVRAYKILGKRPQ